MNYSIKQLAQKANISVRTLHHYDDIGLLCPKKAENGYRVYDDQDALRLQQILFFKELDFELQEIISMLDNPAFDQVQALKDQKQLLVLKKKRLSKLITSITRTINTMSNNKTQNTEEMYNAFEDEDVKRYQSEVKLRWGNTDAYKQSQERMAKMTKAEVAQMKKDAEVFNKKLASLIDKGPDDKEVQEMIAQHYNGLRKFYEPTLEMYEGLAKMYVRDPRFAKYYNKYDPRMAQFMHDAMMKYIKTVRK